MGGYGDGSLRSDLALQMEGLRRPYSSNPQPAGYGGCNGATRALQAVLEAAAHQSTPVGHAAVARREVHCRAVKSSGTCKGHPLVHRNIEQLKLCMYTEG